jgi:anaerobic C4-dicarboxylate transporter
MLKKITLLSSLILFNATSMHAIILNSEGITTANGSFLSWDKMMQLEQRIDALTKEISQFQDQIKASQDKMIKVRNRLLIAGIVCIVALAYINSLRSSNQEDELQESNELI